MTTRKALDTAIMVINIIIMLITCLHQAAACEGAERKILCKQMQMLDDSGPIACSTNGGARYGRFPCACSMKPKISELAAEWSAAAAHTGLRRGTFAMKADCSHPAP